MWVLAFRPKTLTAALVPILVGTAWVYFLGYRVQIWISALALLASFFIQIATNLVNDAADFEKGADTETRLGPTRVTQSGLFTAKQVWMMSAVFFLLATACGLPLVIHGGWPIVIVGLLSLFFAYGYTAGPFPLAYLGLGDFFVILFFGLIAVSGLVYLQTQSWDLGSFLLGLQIGLHAAVLIAINNLRDSAQDVLVGKKTLAVRLGKDLARLQIGLMIFLPFVLNFLWLPTVGAWAVFLPFLALPLAFKIFKLILETEPGTRYNQFLGMSAGLHLMFGLLLGLGLVLCRLYGPGGSGSIAIN